MSTALKYSRYVCLQDYARSTPYCSSPPSHFAASLVRVISGLLMWYKSLAPRGVSSANLWLPFPTIDSIYNPWAAKYLLAASIYPLRLLMWHGCGLTEHTDLLTGPSFCRPQKKRADISPDSVWADCLLFIEMKSDCSRPTSLRMIHPPGTISTRLNQLRTSELRAPAIWHAPAPTTKVNPQSPGIAVFHFALLISKPFGRQKRTCHISSQQMWMISASLHISCERHSPPFCTPFTYGGVSSRAS